MSDFELISAEPSALTPAQIAEQRAAIDELLGGARPGREICLRQRITQLHTEARKLRGKQAPSWEWKEHNTDAAHFLELIEQELTKQWNKGLRSIAADAHDKIVRECSEVASLERQLRAKQRQLAEMRTETDEQNTLSAKLDRKIQDLKTKGIK